MIGLGETLGCMCRFEILCIKISNLNMQRTISTDQQGGRQVTSCCLLTHVDVRQRRTGRSRLAALYQGCSTYTQLNTSYYRQLVLLKQLVNIYTVSKKTPTILFLHNFGKSWPILHILSFLNSARNLQ